jgi:hypothetical protein
MDSGRMTFRIVVTLTVGCALASASCERSPSSATSEATRDSAGIHIIQHTGPAPAQWVVGDTVNIGKVEGTPEYTFNRVSDLSVGPDGRIYVLDSGDNVVRAYTPDGTFAYKLGGPGDGPSEFRGAYRLLWAGDTLEVFDARVPKLVQFVGPAFVDSRPSRLTIWEYGGPALLARVPEGFVAVFVTGCRLPRPKDLRPLWKVVTLDPTGAVRDTVAILTNTATLPIYWATGCSGMNALGRAGPQLAVRPDGRAAYGDGSTYQVALFDLPAAPPGGYHGAMPKPDLVIRRQAEAPTLSQDSIDAYRSRYTKPPKDRPVNRDMIHAVEAAWDSTGFPDHLPFYRALLWDDQGRLWVGETPAEHATVQRWAVYGDEGALLAEMELPVVLSVKAISHERVWGTVTDELGVTYVRGYRIEPGG